MDKVVFYLKQFAVLNNITKTFYRTQGNQAFVRWRDLDTTLIAELLARAKRAQSGAPWVRKFGKLSI